MISSDNAPRNRESSDGDFTVDAYQELVVLAKNMYVFACYDDIPWGRQFVLWRHDCDYSLNRAFALARIEAAEGVRATYFLNLHSEFYNLFERSQYRLVQDIIAMGHRIGLHFDAAFHDIPDEESLAAHVRNEAVVLEGLFDVRPAAFSFHNPLASHFRCDEESYGGLVNCYSLRLKTEVPYCSDSNGYWRFRRLRDVLAQATDPCLQVLTHPGWWQDCEMPPRQRIFRSVYGRARATIADYDATILAHGRENLSGAADAIAFLHDVLPERYATLDLLWMSGEMATLFVELWRLHESQINRLCKALLRKEWQVPAREVNAFFENPALAIDGWRLSAAVFGQPWQAEPAVGADAYSEWVRLRNQLVQGRGAASKLRLEQGCVFVCDAIRGLSAWGLAQPIAYDGLRHLGSIGLPTVKTADGSLSERLEEVAGEILDFPKRRWEEFKATFGNTGLGGT